MLRIKESSLILAPILLFAAAAWAVRVSGPADFQPAAVVEMPDEEIGLDMCLEPVAGDDVTPAEPAFMVGGTEPPPGAEVWFREGPEGATTPGEYTVEFSFVGGDPDGEVRLYAGFCELCTTQYGGCYAYTSPLDADSNGLYTSCIDVGDVGTNGDCIDLDTTGALWYLVHYVDDGDAYYSQSVYVNTPESTWSPPPAPVIWGMGYDDDLCILEQVIRSGKVSHILISGLDRSVSLDNETYDMDDKAVAIINMAHAAQKEVIWSRHMWIAYGENAHTPEDAVDPDTYDDAIDQVIDEAEELGELADPDVEVLTALDGEPYACGSGSVAWYFKRCCTVGEDEGCGDFVGDSEDILEAIELATTGGHQVDFVYPVASPRKATSYAGLFGELGAEGGDVCEDTYHDKPEDNCWDSEPEIEIFGVWAHTSNYHDEGGRLYLPTEIIERDYLWNAEAGAIEPINGLFIYTDADYRQAVANMMASYFAGPGVLHVYSCRNHTNVGELCIDAGCPTACNPGRAETRIGGVEKLKLELTAPVDSVGLQVSCTGGTSYTGDIDTDVSTDGLTVEVTFDPGLPDDSLCTLTFGGEQGGDLDDVVYVQVVKGDTLGDGNVSPGDRSVIAPHFTQTADEDHAIYDIDCSGVITTGDYSQVTPEIGDFAPDCPS